MADPSMPVPELPEPQKPKRNMRTLLIGDFDFKYLCTVSQGPSAMPQ